ncbi:MAG: alpha/beta family hydrolase [Propionibacteriaceae bacterium]
MTARATTVYDVATPQGPGRFYVDAAGQPTATLVLGHGAGGGVTAADLELLARRLPPLGITVARFEQPWRTAGGRVAVPPPRLDIGWRAGIEWLVGQPWATPGLFFGGRSAGARVACRTANDFEVAGVVCLAFPLHLPGQPHKSRLPELLTPTAPRLVLQGSNDSFGGSAEVLAAVGEAPGVKLVELPGADHSFRLAKASPFTPSDLRESVYAEVATFVLGGE